MIAKNGYGFDFIILVDYYSNREFVRGIFLKYPVNEKSVGQYASNELNVSGPGCYMDLKDLDKEVFNVLVIEMFIFYL